MSKTMIEKISLNEYKNFYKDYEYGNVFVSPDYMRILSEIKNIELYAVLKNEEPEALFPVNSIKKGIVSIFLNPPFTPYFNIVFRNCPKTERERVRRLELIITPYVNFLKKRFFYYSVGQSPELTDSRYFSWAGARASLMYTYSLKINPESLASADRMLRNKKRVVFRESQDYEKAYRMVRESYKNKPPINKNDYMRLSGMLKENKMIRTFFSDEAAVVFLIDTDSNSAFAYNICGSNTGLLIYSVIAEDLFKGMELDFMGANTRRIATYKSMFNPHIKSYFRVSGIYDIFH